MKRIANICIVVESPDSVEEINTLLHEYRNIIIGRMGLPLASYGISLINTAVCAEEGEISALAGGLGRIPSVSVKTAYSAKEIK